ncbi:tetratricopeptide repeat protein [Chloroflexus sp. MS-CIW-1]|uniref:tetratricopeptide repeat protein n=1 Tax=Chloroflexus sp. MS-CIW-1 TaxID=3055768 RepID=UPI0034627D3D
MLGADPGAEERKLTTLLPLAFKYQGRIAEARRLFQQATQANPKDPVSWQAWALLEKEQGDIAEARRLFQQASQADPKTPLPGRPGR